MTRRPLIIVFVVLALAAMLSLRPVAQTTQTPEWREYPLADQRVQTLVRRGVDAKRATQALAQSPGVTATLKLLFEQDRIADALTSLESALRGDLTTVIAALNLVGDQFFRFNQDQSRGYPDRLRQLIDPQRSRLSTLGREDAARLARVFAAVDSQLERGGSAGWQNRMAQFVRDYEGTEEAQLMQVSLMSSGNGPLLQRIDALDRFWQEHPGTKVGAVALYEKGFQLHVNVAITGVERRGSDPTDRLLQVAAIVKELESGKYPSGRWTTEAPSLMSGFFVSSQPTPVYQPGNIERSIAAYQEFVRAHFNPNGTEDPIDSSIGYVITTRIGDLAERLGDRVGGIERSLDDLAAHGADARAVELFRAEYYARRAAMLDQARTALTKLADTGADFPARKALATLAALEFSQRDYSRALPVYERYRDSYPASPWTWVAALRIAQCHELQGDWRGAADAYQHAADGFAAEPLARVFAFTFLARAREAMGQFDQALPAYRRALDAWDAGYGAVVSIATNQVAPGTRPTGPTVDRMSVTKDFLADRVASLERDNASPGGLLLARGRWQLEQQQYAAAEATFAQYLRQFQGTASAADVRVLVHRAQLEEAFELAAIEGPKHDDAAAMKALTVLGAEALDSAVAAARLSRAALLLKQGASADAASLMQSTLDAWMASQQPLATRPPASPIDADIAAIRQVVFRPAGDSILGTFHWNAFTFPSSLPPVVVIRPDVAVKTPDGLTSTHVVYQRFAGMEKVLFLNADELTLLSRVISTLGGTGRRAPAQVMETPNQPVGASVDIVAMWTKYFPARQGHWGGWVLETYPIIHQIEFTNAERTKANVNVEVGYSGGTIVMEKVDGQWRAIRLVNQWIT